jgi:hypothetical protein
MKTEPPPTKGSLNSENFSGRYSEIVLIALDFPPG